MSLDGRSNDILLGEKGPHCSISQVPNMSIMSLLIHLLQNSTKVQLSIMVLLSVPVLFAGNARCQFAIV